MLTYCTNIHAGETWPEVFDNLKRHLPRVREHVVGDVPFGVGLRLSGEAAQTLCDDAELDRLRDFSQNESLYVFTLNGFPYGRFHGEPVKAEVYQPDWTTRARVNYTKNLARVLGALLPEAVAGSISTVPAGFKARLQEPKSVAQVVAHLVEIAAELHCTQQETGKELVLALEPEPCCLLETTAETVDFFENEILGRSARTELARLLDIDEVGAEPILRRHLGVCLDACHAAVEFEEPCDTLARLDSAGLRVAKAQLSAGLRLPELSRETLGALEQYDERVYLHQVVARANDGQLLRFCDLSEAFASDQARRAAEWRVHFHVPLYTEHLDGFVNTQPFLSELLDRQRVEPFTEQLEVETYTWDVLPEQHKSEDVTVSIARELEWVLERLAQ